MWTFDEILVQVENVEDGVVKLFVRVGLYAQAQKHAHHVHKVRLSAIFLMLRFLWAPFLGMASYFYFD